ncbi:MAG: phytanoyl-CoA dioxygenase family protein [Terriglobales bacterium]
MTREPKVDIDSFRRQGYAIVPGVFSAAEMQALRARLERLRDRERNERNIQEDAAHPQLTLILGDVLGKRELRDLEYVLFDDRVLACARQILGDRLVYFGDSSIQTGEGLRGFHKDNVDRTSDPTAPDWQGEYPLIRFGVYAQDHSRYSGGLKVREKSHNYPFKHRGKAVNLQSKAGDLIFWSLRTTHSGNNVRLRMLPDLVLHPRLENLVPRSWRVPEEQERFAIFGTFAAPGAHLDRYIQFIANRADYLPHFTRCGLGPELRDWLSKKGVDFRLPREEYASQYQAS